MVQKFTDMKRNNEKISMITAYDYYSAKLVEEASIDIILVGDSLGMVFQGQENTLPVTVEEMIYHAKAVKRGAKNSYIVTDLPFMSYQLGVKEALATAGKIVKETGTQAVKLEGGKRVIPQIEAMVGAGIPVMGHLGLTPQSVNQLGGFKLQGGNKESALEIIDDALALQEAGVFSIVLETVPKQLAEIISEKLTIPTIGIGAGLHCDGQVLVIHDLLGIDNDFKPGFVRQYAELNRVIKGALQDYIKDVKEENFPADKESFTMDDKFLTEIKEELD